MSPPRRLTAEERAVWRKLVETVKPLARPRANPQPDIRAPEAPIASPAEKPAPRPRGGIPRVTAAPARVTVKAPPPPLGEDRRGLDASWERRIAKGGLDPDFTLDLHGAGLDAAYVRLMRGLTQAKALGARVILVVTGKPRPVEAADRGQTRGAIRAKIGDWLAASEHAGDIAAVRGAHRRHGAQGALYVILKKRR